MDKSETLEQILSMVKKNWVVFLPLTLGLMLLGYGLIGLLASDNQEEKVVLESDTAAAQEEKKELAVDISGAVLQPGLYELPQDGRVKDALVAAGGLSKDADRSWVSKNINLAARLSDGMKIYIPTVNEAPSSSAASDTLTQIPGKVNINTASQAQLEALPGIGPVTAGKIIDNRPYTKIEELLEKKIVGQSTYEKIKDSISVF